MAAHGSGELQSALQSPEAYKAWVKGVGKAQKRKGKRLFMPLRVALTGNTHVSASSAHMATSSAQHHCHLEINLVDCQLSPTATGHVLRILARRHKCCHAHPACNLLPIHGAGVASARVAAATSLSHPGRGMQDRGSSVRITGLSL